jgi:hypothetical protein
MVCCRVVWCDVVQYGVVWCGVVWCGVGCALRGVGWGLGEVAGVGWGARCMEAWVHLHQSLTRREPQCAKSNVPSWYVAHHTIKVYPTVEAKQAARVRDPSRHPPSYRRVPRQSPAAQLPPPP